jgi:TRAP-type C4-dicarboxylate transport system substrate-binding protein
MSLTLLNIDVAAAKSKTITIRYATMDAKQSWTATHSLLPWMNAVEKATSGQVKFEPYWSNTLSKPFDNWESVKSGVADAGDCVMAFWPGLAPISDVISLPFVGVESAEQGGAVFWQLYEKYPSLQAEYKDVHVLFFGVANPNILMTTKKQVKSVEDIKGLKLRVTGGPPTNYLKAVGASPMLVAMTDVYMNLQKGVIDGVIASWTSVESMKFHEVIDYINNVPIYATFAARVMNLNTWNRLPKDVQQAITECGGLERSIEFSKTQFDDHVAVVKKAGYDITQYTPNAQELAQWKASAKSIQDQWVADMSAAGHPEAQEILDTAKALLNAYKK